MFTVGDPRPVRGVRGNLLGYEMSMAHQGLRRHRVLKGRAVSVCLEWPTKLE